MMNRNLFILSMLSTISLAASPAFPEPETSATALEKSDSSRAPADLSSVPVSNPDDSATPAVPKVADNPGAPKKAKGFGDTIFAFRIGDPHLMIKSINHFVDSMTQRGFGGGGGPMAGVFAVDMRPFIDLAHRVQPLRGKDFPFGSLRYKAFFMNGGMGFAGIGGGLRIGGGGMSGERHFTSQRYAGDSLINYSTKISWGGFLIEKLVTREKYSCVIGGYLGSGSLKAGWVKVNDGYSAFDHFDWEDDENEIKAFFGYFELHGGTVYNIAPWMHVCGDVSLPVIVSTDGFAPYTKEFISLCPGLRVRLIFGNLG